MKVELTKKGYIKVVAENITEGWALNNIWPLDLEIMDRQQNQDRLIIDCSVLSQDITNRGES